MRDADWTPARANPVGIRVEAVYLGIHTVAPNCVLHRPVNANRPSPEEGRAGKHLSRMKRLLGGGNDYWITNSRKRTSATCFSLGRTALMRPLSSSRARSMPMALLSSSTRLEPKVEVITS